MKETSRKTLEEIIRVDHAGERGAIKIYEGQLLALKTLKKDEVLKDQIEKMKEHEQEHLNYFEKEIQKRKIKPTNFLPLWDVMGVFLGFSTALLGKKAAMLCTASVEEVIETSTVNGNPLLMLLEGYNHVHADGKYVLDVLVFDADSNKSVCMHKKAGI